MLSNNIPSNLHYICLWAGCLGCAITFNVFTLIGILFYNNEMLFGGKSNSALSLSTALHELYFAEKGQTSYTVLTSQDILIYNSIYLFVSCIWLLVSILLMIPVHRHHWMILAKLLGWIITTLIISILDVIIGIIFAIDYHNSDCNTAEEIMLALASIVMMIVAFKGFVLWLINIILVIYLILQIITIQQNNNNISQLFNFAKNSEAESISSIQSLKMEGKPSMQPKCNDIIRGYTNESFEAERTVQLPELNGEALIRAARSSIVVAAQERRFRNLDAYVQYPPRPSTSNPTDLTAIQQHPPTPIPDYTPPPITRNLRLSTTNYKS